jgi:hypothetical protein
MAHNAASAGRFFANRPRRPTILVSLSKGGADVRTAMQRPDAAIALRDVTAWVNLSGMVTGTPLVAWLRDRPLRCLGVRLLLRLRRQRFAHIEELSCGERAPLRPAVYGAAARAHDPRDRLPTRTPPQQRLGRRGHARLAPLGPNDGGGILLRDVTTWPGHIYPVWSADHYLRHSFDVDSAAPQYLREAARPQTETVAAPSDLA